MSRDGSELDIYGEKIFGAGSRQKDRIRISSKYPDLDKIPRFRQYIPGSDLDKILGSGSRQDTRIRNMSKYPVLYKIPGSESSQNNQIRISTKYLEPDLVKITGFGSRKIPGAGTRQNTRIQISTNYLEPDLNKKPDPDLVKIS